MKIGIATNSFAKASYGRWQDKTYEKLRAHGFVCTDFDMSDTTKGVYAVSDTEAKEMLLFEKSLADKAGVKIWQVHGPWRFPARDTTEADRAERMEKMKKSIEYTAFLGCENWVVHPLMPFGIDDLNTPEAQQTWDINLFFMKELLKTAKEAGVTICFENMPFLNFSMSKPEVILKFVNEINDDNFKICLDTGHVGAFCGLNAGDEVRRLKGKIKALHVHDTKYGEDYHLLPYMGVIDWADFASALKETGFEGCFSLETNPPSKLDDECFDEASRLLFKVAEKIVAGN